MDFKFEIAKLLADAAGISPEDAVGKGCGGLAGEELAGGDKVNGLCRPVAPGVGELLAIVLQLHHGPVRQADGNGVSRRNRVLQNGLLAA